MIGFILIFWSSKTWRSDRALPIATSVLIGYCDLFGFVFTSCLKSANKQDTGKLLTNVSLNEVL